MLNEDPNTNPVKRSLSSNITWTSNTLQT
jgi:hypothetical protein